MEREYRLSHVLFKPFSPMELVRVATSLLEQSPPENHTDSYSLSSEQPA